MKTKMRASHRLVATVEVLSALLGFTPLAAQEIIELPRSDDDLEVAVETAYAIGGVQATGWDLFGDVSQVQFDQDGNLYVLDRQTMRITVVAPDGSLVRQFGTRGDGPGEFRRPGAIGVTRDGRVFVQDGGHQAYIEFDQDGEFVRQVPMDVVDGVLVMSSLETDPTGPHFFTSPAGGGFMMMSRTVDGPGASTVSPPTERPIQRLTLEGSVEAREFYRAWDPPEPSTDAITAPGNANVAIRQRVVWEPRLFFQALPDGGLAVVDSSAWAIEIVDASGTHVRTLLRPSIEPRRVTDRIREREVQRRADQIEAGEGPRMRIVTNDGSGDRELPQSEIRRMQVERLRGAPFWPEIPVARDMAVDWSGVIWFERAQVDPDEPGPIDLVRSSGEYLGTLAADSDVRTPAAFGPDGLAAWIIEDEFGVATIRVGRLGGPLS